MARSIPIQLPPERMEQLRQIGSALGGLSPSRVIAHMIRGEIRRGTIRQNIPGYAIERNGKTVSIETEAWRKDMTTEDAARLAKAVRGILTPSKRNPFLPFEGLNLSRQGTALKLTDPDTGEAQIIAASVAPDLADAIEAASE